MNEHTFAVGDRVRIVNHPTPAWNGVTAIVTGVHPDGVSLTSAEHPENIRANIGHWGLDFVELIDGEVYYLVDQSDRDDIAKSWFFRENRWYLIGDNELAEGTLFNEGTEATNTQLTRGLDAGVDYIQRIWGILDDGVTTDDEPEHQQGYAPMVLAHKTSREYARKLRTSKIDVGLNFLLWEACHGKEVDAYTFRLAVTAALRVAVTRVGKRYDGAYREVRTRQAAHLLHIADAVIENHRMGLPAMEAGERSPALKAAKEAIAKLERQLQATTEGWSRTGEEIENQLEFEKERTTALVREKTELEIELEDVKAEQLREFNRAEEAQQDAAAKALENSELRREVARLNRQVEAHRRTLVYAQKVFRDVEADNFAERLDGYLQALLDLASEA